MTTRDRTERRVPFLKNAEGANVFMIQQCRLCGVKQSSRGGTFPKCKCEQTKYELPYMVEEIKEDRDGSTTTNKYIIARDVRDGSVRVLQRTL